MTTEKTTTVASMQPFVMRSDAERWLRLVVSAKLALDSKWSQMQRLSGCTADSEFGRAAWRPLELLVDCVDELFASESKTVNWFVWDNDCGRKKLKHSLPDGTMRTVKGWRDMLDVLGF
jgi:hypothetical protein